MLDYVIDANVIMSVLISGKAQYKPIFKAYHFYAPEYIHRELEEYHSIILTQTRLDTSAFRRYSQEIFEALTIVPDW